jgi:hypothetical protein
MIVRAVVTSCIALLAACAAQHPAPPSTAGSPGPSHSTEIAASAKEPEPKATPTPEPKRESKPEPAKPEAKPKDKPKPKPSTAEARPAERQPKPPSPAATPAPAAAKSPAPLDLTSLEERLKQTDAIGLLTKLSLKNQVDDLVGEFREYHRGARPPTLAQLRPAFDLLLMKVLSLLQDRDPALAHDVSASREAIWAVLNDPHKLAEFS